MWHADVACFAPVGTLQLSLLFFMNCPCMLSCTKAAVCIARNVSHNLTPLCSHGLLHTFACALQSKLGAGYHNYTVISALSTGPQRTATMRLTLLMVVFLRMASMWLSERMSAKQDPHALRVPHVEVKGLGLGLHAKKKEEWLGGPSSAEGSAGGAEGKGEESSEEGEWVEQEGGITQEGTSASGAQAAPSQPQEEGLPDELEGCKFANPVLSPIYPPTEQDLNHVRPITAAWMAFMFLGKFPRWVLPFGESKYELTCYPPCDKDVLNIQTIWDQGGCSFLCLSLSSQHVHLRASFHCCRQGFCQLLAFDSCVYGIEWACAARVPDVCGRAVHVRSVYGIRHVQHVRVRPVLA